jgi:hypothetical protein
VADGYPHRQRHAPGYQADRAAKTAAENVRQRVMALSVDMAINMDAKDYKDTQDVLLQIRFDGAFAPGPAVERTYIWRHGHMETCESNYGGPCDCVAGKPRPGVAP